MSPEVVLLAIRLALAAGLYAFLALTLIYLWRDLRLTARGPAEVPTAYLEIIEPADLGPGFPLAALNLIGRAPDNTLVIDENTVSSHHARLSYQQGQWWLEDLGSKNGTGVNDIDVADPLVVTFGDRIRLGKVDLLLRSGSAPESTIEPEGVESDLESAFPSEETELI